MDSLGGEGIVLKDPVAPYEPGPRSPTWLKHKQPLRLPIGVLEGSGEIVRRGDRG